MAKVDSNRVSQILPTVKCSSCGMPVEFRKLGDHVCRSAPPLPTSLTNQSYKIPSTTNQFYKFPPLTIHKRKPSQDSAIFKKDLSFFPSSTIDLDSPQDSPTTISPNSAWFPDSPVSTISSSSSLNHSTHPSINSSNHSTHPSINSSNHSTHPSINSSSSKLPFLEKYKRMASGKQQTSLSVHTISHSRTPSVDPIHSRSRTLDPLPKLSRHHSADSRPHDSQLLSERPSQRQSSERPNLNLSLERPTSTLSSERPNLNLSSERPTSTLSSERPNSNLSSERPTSTLSSERPNSTLSSATSTLSSSYDEGYKSQSSRGPSPSRQSSQDEQSQRGRKGYSDLKNENNKSIRRQKQSGKKTKAYDDLMQDLMTELTQDFTHDQNHEEDQNLNDFSTSLNQYKKNSSQHEDFSRNNSLSPKKSNKKYNMDDTKRLNGNISSETLRNHIPTRQDIDEMYANMNLKSSKNSNTINSTGRKNSQNSQNSQNSSNPSRSRQCFECQNPIEQKYIFALSNYYHPKCLNCQHCHFPIDNHAFAEKNNQVYCKHDYAKLFLPKCRECNHPIESRAVSSADGKLEGKWHSECFTCHKCKTPFPDKTFYVFNRTPYCKRHYHELNQSICAKCDGEIEGPCAHVDDKRYHPNCFSCSKCCLPLEEYYEFDYQFWCDSHIIEAQRRKGNSNGKRAEKRRTIFKDVSSARR